MNIKNIIQILIPLAFLMSTIPNVMAYEWGVDAKGSADHPMFSRYPGSWIKEYSFKEFDEYALKTAIEKSDALEVEGEVTRILYVSPKSISSAQIFRNYEKALDDAGFDEIFKCKGKVNGCGWMTEDLGKVDGPAIIGDDCRFKASNLNRDGSFVFVALYVCDMYDSDYTFAYLHVIEEEALETGLVTVNAEKLQEDILAEGHVELEGVFFDTDKATLKPESKPTLDEVGKLLSENAELNLLVVGHTDNVGKLEYNVDLSNRRAQAVVNALVNDYGIDASRLNAFGAGMYAPVASNASEDGRKQNRRVELVQR